MSLLLKNFQNLFSRFKSNPAAPVLPSLPDTSTDVLAKLTPWMRFYKDHFFPWLYQPFVMHGYKPNFQSRIVNTDRFGLRHTQGQNDKLITLDNTSKKSCSLIVGGSVVFGWGATEDRYTISSELSRNLDESWLNFGTGGYVLQQNLVQLSFLQNRLPKVDRIVFLGGLNELTIFILSELYSPVYGAMFFESTFLESMNEGFHDLCGPEAELDGDIFVKINNFEKQRDVLFQSLSSVLYGLKQMARSMDTELHFVLQPLPGWMSRKPSETELLIWQHLDEIKGQTLCEIMGSLISASGWYRSFLASECKKNAIPFIDLNEELSASQYDYQWLFSDRGHLTNEGNYEVARLIERLTCSQPIETRLEANKTL